MSKKRYSSKELPPYQFVPGLNPHPKKSGGHMEGESDPQCEPINRQSPFESEILRYGLDLFNSGHYWEAHVYFEALWNAHGRTGSEALFFQGLIKISAAFLKLKLGQSDLYRQHLERAKELFELILSREEIDFLGFHLPNIIQEIEEAMVTKGVTFEVHPRW
jgi:hypothetical protein